MQPKPKGFSTGATVAIAILVALVAFAAGIRVDEYDNITGKSDQETVNQQLPEDLDYESVEAVYDALRQNYDGELTVDQLLEGLKDGLAQATGDVYTVYLTAEEAKAFEDDLNGTFIGIGAEIGLRDGLLIVVAPISGFPAEQADLRPQDAILEIDGQDTTGMSVEEAVGLIRGEKDTTVDLKILRGTEELDKTITRQEIVVPSVTTEILDGNIGYLRVSRFAEDTRQLALEAATDFKAQNVNGVILDLRNNSGGFLDTSVDIAGLWLDGDVVVEQRRGNTVIDTQRANRGAVLDGVPTVVLINEGSASASEIVAGALQDQGAATLVGVQSFGKGSVQSLEQVGDGDVLKVTIARWFTPGGRNIDAEGIAPNVEVELTEEDFEQQRDPQRDRAVEILSQQ